MVAVRSAWFLALFSAFYPLILGDDVKGATDAINGTTPTASEGEITVHFISVSEELHLFTPNSINALPGDVVSFRFWPGNHSVIRAEYGYPCIPYEDLEGHSGQGFYSEVQSPNATDVEQGTVSAHEEALISAISNELVASCMESNYQRHLAYVFLLRCAWQLRPMGDDRSH